MPAFTGQDHIPRIAGLDHDYLVRQMRGFKTGRTRAGLRAGVAALSLGAAGAFAQQAPAAAEPRVADVVVTATRVPQRSLDIPAAIDSVDAATLREDRPQVNLSEALGRVPGVSVQNRQNYAQDLQVSSRGFGGRATFGVRGVRLIADGVPATMPDGQGQAATFDLATADRIEVLRGPFASLYGNSSGGVIQVFTADGPAEPEADVSLVAARGRQAHRGRERPRPAGLAGPAGPHPRPVRGGPAPGRRVRVPLRHAQERPPGAARRGPRPAARPRRFPAGPDLRRHALRPSVPGADGRHPPQGSGGVVDLDRRYGGAGVRWTRTVPGERPFVFSLGAERDALDERRRGYVNDFGTAGALRRDEDDTVASTDAYAQGEWRFAPGWSASAGARHSRVAFESRDRYATAANPDDSGGVAYSRTVPVAGLVFEPDPGWRLYANAGGGFETPTFAELAYRPGGATGLNFALQRARSRHAEIGAKARLPEGGRLTAALFRIDTRDEIVTDTSVGGRTTFKNASRTRRDGFELAADGRLGGGLEASVAYTWLDARFTEGFTSGTPPVPVPAGSRLPGVPGSMLYAELVWRHAASGFHAGAEVRASGKVRVNDANTDAAPGYGVASLRAGLERRFGSWRFSAFARVDNVGDHAYAGSVIVAESRGRYFEPAPGRSWMAGATAAASF